MSYFKFTRVSGNSKTGPIPTTMSSGDTCPDNCGLKKNGCYADFGMVGMHWRKVDKGEYSGDWGQLCGHIQSLPKQQLWRMNVAGDLPSYAGLPDTINGEMMDTLIGANKGKNGFTYTHHIVTGTDPASLDNRRIIRKANEAGFTVNLSADTLGQADMLANLSIGPVVCILPVDAPKLTLTPAGRSVITCPATYQDNVNCSNCGICQVSTRKAIIGFPAHGSGKKKAEKVFKGIAVKTIKG